MAEQPEQQLEEVPDVDEETPGYKPPAPKSLNEIQNLDQDDESLQKYKETLLGKAGDVVIGKLCIFLYDFFKLPHFSS